MSKPQTCILRRKRCSSERFPSRRRRWAPGDHPDVAATLGSLGNLALVQHQPTAALPLLERAVIIYDAHEGVQFLEQNRTVRRADANGMFPNAEFAGIRGLEAG